MNMHELTTAEPTATPAAVDAICANRPGCLGCAIGVAGAAGGGWAGMVDTGRDGAGLIGEGEADGLSQKKRDMRHV